MTFILSILLFCLCVVPVRAIFQIKNKVQSLLAIYLVWFGLIILAAEISGFLVLLSNQWFFLILQVLEAAVLWGIWWKKGKPALFLMDGNQITTWLRSVSSQAKKHLWIGLFAFMVCIGYCILAYLIVRVPPNNTDSMHTHLARVIYWLQQGSFQQLTSYSIFARIYPFNAQLNVLWTVLFSRSDQFVGFVQFFAALFCGLAIYGICRLMDGKQKYSLLISLIWLTLPQVVFQATTTQFDLVSTALFTITVFFFFDYIKNWEFRSLVLSGIGLGLSIGAKQTVFMMAPAFVIILLLLLIAKKLAFRFVLRWMAISLVSFLLMGSYIYFNNLHVYGNPLGPSEHVQSDSLGVYSFIEKLRVNPARFLVQLTNFDALPVRMANRGNQIKNDLFRYLDEKLNLQMESPNALKDIQKDFSLDEPPYYNEDLSWFGIGGALLILTSFFAGIYAAIKKKDFLSFSLVLFGISFLIFEILLRPGWDPYQGRYFIMPVALILPLAIHLFKSNPVSRLYQVMICLLVLMSFWTAILTNESKPIIGKKLFENKYQALLTSGTPDSAVGSIYKEYKLKILYVIWDNLPFQKSIAEYSDTELRTLGNQRRHLNILNAVNQSIPEDAKIGIMLVVGDFDYVFFGTKLTRILINIQPITEINQKDWLTERGISYVLISDFKRIPEIPSFLDMITQVDGWGLYTVATIP